MTTMYELAAAAGGGGSTDQVSREHLSLVIHNQDARGREIERRVSLAGVKGRQDAMYE